VTDREHLQIIQGPEDLIRVKFRVNLVQLFFLNYLVKIVRVVIHDYIQILFLSFVTQEAVLHLEHIWVVKHLQD